MQNLEIGRLRSRQGFDKLKNTCARAAADGFDYVWIDICCIDKRSSAELSEAINSRYRWYQNAIVCYAYLDDVCADPVKDPNAKLYENLTYEEVREQNLRVMDPTAIAHCMEHNLPILVFNYGVDGNIERAVRGERIGTRISR